ncbi:hypothetical protein TNCV_2707301 [Trichonephila clavipes]|nr:hypothetical protein TNCV_2707301 [Trichonephila clavipes]
MDGVLGARVLLPLKTRRVDEAIPPTDVVVRKEGCQLRCPPRPRPWGTRIYPHAPRRAGGQAGFPEMGQYFQVDCKKSQLFKNFPLVLDDDETSLGQVTKLAPDAEVGHRSGKLAFQVEPFIDVPVGPAGGREEVRVVHREANNVWIFLRDVGNSMVGQATMVKHVSEKG